MSLSELVLIGPFRPAAKAAVPKAIFRVVVQRGVGDRLVKLPVPEDADGRT